MDWNLDAMPLSIKDPEADRLAREVAQKMGETIAQAVINSLRERLARERRGPATLRRRLKPQWPSVGTMRLFRSPIRVRLTKSLATTRTVSHGDH